MFSATHRQLKILAALLWMTGGIILVLKAVSLLSEAQALNATGIWHWLAIVIGLSVGLIKVKFIFRHVCRKNLRRIDRLERPKMWHFYRPGFFLFLAIMISSGATLSRMAHGDYSMLIAVAILDLSVATALLGSSPVFYANRDKFAI
ncbi:MAG: hypothetical protein L3J28_00320 [Candidatus Polarisedimenticolaceae bacterium]|nr:hypothetical protein [Candidatus Polarisedimenticolaceae bacterium]